MVFEHLTSKFYHYPKRIPLKGGDEFLFRKITLYCAPCDIRRNKFAGYFQKPRPLGRGSSRLHGFHTENNPALCCIVLGDFHFDAVSGQNSY